MLDPQIEAMDKRFRNVENIVNKVEEKTDLQSEQMQTISENITSVLRLMQGDKFNPSDKGFLGWRSHMEERVARLEKFKERAIYVLVGMGIGAGFGIAKIMEFLNK